MEGAEWIHTVFIGLENKMWQIYIACISLCKFLVSICYFIALAIHMPVVYICASSSALSAHLLFMNSKITYTHYVFN